MKNSRPPTQSIFGISIAVVLGILGGTLVSAHKSEDGTQSVVKKATDESACRFDSWRDLSPIKAMSDGNDFRYFEFQTVNGSKARLIVIDLSSKRFSIQPVLNESTSPSSETAQRVGATAAVNGGFFNLTNGESTSYVVIDGKQVCEPKTNKALITNEKLKPYLENIFNRSELRFVTMKGMAAKDTPIQVRISKHNDKLSEGETLIHALQGGPRLLPELTDRAEAFVRTDADGQQTDSIGVYRTAARTCFGVTPDGHAMILCVAGKGQDEFSSGVTLAQLASILKQLGCTEAVNFDGGTSTTMVVRQHPNPKPGEQPVGDEPAKARYERKGTLIQVCGREPETKVKSVLAVIKRL